MTTFSTTVQQYLNGKVTELIGRSLEYFFYDVTNYYTERTLQIRMRLMQARRGQQTERPALVQKRGLKRTSADTDHPGGALSGWERDPRLHGYLLREHERF